MDRLERRFRRDLGTIGRPAPPGAAAVTEDEVDALPAPVATYLRAMAVVGRSRVRSFRATFEGRFRRTPTGRWWSCTALQYNAALPSPTRLVRARWSTPIDHWVGVGDHPYPTSAAAVWELPDGPFRYIEGQFVPGTVVVGDAEPVEVSS